MCLLERHAGERDCAQATRSPQIVGERPHCSLWRRFRFDHEAQSIQVVRGTGLVGSGYARPSYSCRKRQASGTQYAEVPG